MTWDLAPYRRSGCECARQFRDLVYRVVVGPPKRSVAVGWRAVRRELRGPVGRRGAPGRRVVDHVLPCATRRGSGAGVVLRYRSAAVPRRAGTRRPWRVPCGGRGAVAGGVPAPRLRHRAAVPPPVRHRVPRRWGRSGLTQPPRTCVTHSDGGSNSPERREPTKSCQCCTPKVRIGPSGSLESRTATTVGSSAISTQAPLPALRLLFRQHRSSPSGAAAMVRHILSYGIGITSRYLPARQ